MRSGGLERRGSASEVGDRAAAHRHLDVGVEAVLDRLRGCRRPGAICVPTIWPVPVAATLASATSRVTPLVDALDRGRVGFAVEAASARRPCRPRCRRWRWRRWRAEQPCRQRGWGSRSRQRRNQRQARQDATLEPKRSAAGGRCDVDARAPGIAVVAHGTEIVIDLRLQGQSAPTRCRSSGSPESPTVAASP